MRKLLYILLLFMILLVPTIYADDKISVDYLELALKEFSNNKKLSLVYSKAQRFGEEDALWNLRPFSLYNL